MSRTSLSFYLLSALLMRILFLKGEIPKDKVYSTCFGFVKHQFLIRFKAKKQPLLGSIPRQVRI